MPNTVCPGTERWQALLENALSAADQAALTQHVEACTACRRTLEDLAGGGGWLRHLSGAREASAAGDLSALRQVMTALKSLPVAAEEDQTASCDPAAVDFLSPPDKPGFLGRFGPYDVQEVIAAGGMGVVLKAVDPALHRAVAIKVLAPVLAANATARTRFVREARAAAAVTHDHVVTIHAVDEAGGLPYLVMQFVAGTSLEQRLLHSGPLSLEGILRVGRQIAAGLAAAHAQGLIHRDIKPGNILLENPVERVKITDFGLARATDEAGLTRRGYVAGTPEYMAPEQARGEPLDHRADLFSLGCVLYAMGTGRSPFHSETVIGSIRKVCDEDPPPVHEANQALPVWLSAVISRLLAEEWPARAGGFWISPASLARDTRCHDPPWLPDRPRPEILPP